MAKNKKNIDAFQKAMLSNTKMIKAEEKDKNEKPTSKQKQTKINEETKLSGINPEKIKILENMGNKYGVNVNDLIDKGLDLFISLEDYWFNDNN